MVTFQLQFQFWESEIVGQEVGGGASLIWQIWRDSRQIWRVTQLCHSFFGQKLLDNRCSVQTRIIVEKKELSISIFLAPYGQYTYTNSPKLERKMLHSLFDLQVHIRGELHLCCQKTKSTSLYFIFAMKIFWRVLCSDGHHLELWHFVSRSYAKYQLSSPVIIESKKCGSLLIVSIRS